VQYITQQSHRLASASLPEKNAKLAAKTMKKTKIRTSPFNFLNFTTFITSSMT
jgi:hypothetical protein